jgi:hypothetical protein
METIRGKLKQEWSEISRIEEYQLVLSPFAELVRDVCLPINA